MDHRDGDDEDGVEGGEELPREAGEHGEGGEEGAGAAAAMVASFETEGMEVGKVGGECQREPSCCGEEAVKELGA